MKPSILLWLAFAGLIDCDHVEPPCRVESTQSILQGTNFHQPSWSFTTANQVALLWFSLPNSFAETSSIPLAAEVALFDEQGLLSERKTITTPAGLRARKENTSGIDAAWTGQGVLFRWIESSKQTASDGTETTTITLRAQWVGLDGQEGELLSPEAARCADCSIQLSSTSTPDGAALLFTRSPALKALPSGETIPPPSVTTGSGFVRVTADGVASTGELSWLTVAPSGSLGGLGSAAGSDPPVLENARGTLLVRSAGNAWAVDASLTPIAGPVAAKNGQIDWSATRNEVAVARASATSATASIGTEADLLFQTFSPAGEARNRIERFSTGTGIRSLVRSEDRYGVVFVGDEKPYFSLLDANGIKLDGDLELTSREPSPSSSLGASLGSRKTTEVLISQRKTRFLRLSTVGSAVQRQGVSCAP